MNSWGSSRMTIILKPWTTIGAEEAKAALLVLGRDALSGYLGGVKGAGPQVTALEQEWESTFSVKHALSVNSATSGILAALKACGAGPGTEVICSPYSMSAGVAAIVWCGATPVFADIDATCEINPALAHKACTDNTVAILTTNLFGGAQNLETLCDLAMVKDIKLIEDAAQSPFAKAFGDGPYAGTIGDVGVFSLNVHKPMQSGEGGICVTNNDDLADKIDGIRNHGELRGLPPGLNLRMTELTAAVAIEQLAKGPDIVAYRNKLANRLTDALKGMRSLIIPAHDPCSAYYIWHCTTMPSYREELVHRLQVAGVPVKAGYVQPLHLMPAFSPKFYRDCPVTETIEREIITLEMYAWDLNESLIDQIAEAFWRSAR